MLNLIFCWLLSFYSQIQMNLSAKKYAGCLCAWWKGLRLRLRISNGKRYKGWTLNKGESAVASLPSLVSLSNHLYCTEQIYTVSIPGLKCFIWTAQEQVVRADPCCLAVCANFTLVVKQHETQLFLLNKGLSSQVQWWYIAVLYEMLTLSQTTLFLHYISLSFLPKLP